MAVVMPHESDSTADEHIETSDEASDFSEDEDASIRDEFIG